MPGKKLTEQEVQQKMMQFQLLENNTRALRAQLEQVAARMEELTRTKIGLEDLKDVKAGDSAFVPVGAGAFVEGKISDPSRVLISTGSDVAVKKTREEAIELIDERLAEIQKTAEELAAQERRVAAELQKLQPELQKLLHRH